MAQMLQDYGANIGRVESMMPNLVGPRYMRDSQGNVTGFKPSLTPSIFSSDFGLFMSRPTEYRNYVLSKGANYRQGDFIKSMIPKTVTGSPVRGAGDAPRVVGGGGGLLGDLKSAVSTGNLRRREKLTL